MTATAPAAPARLGEAAEPRELLVYLELLGEWLTDRRRELDELDDAVLRSTLRDQLTTDVTLSLALWQAVSDRHELLLATWDSGRVGLTERQRLSALVWGRLDATLDPSVLASRGPDASALSVSLPEACRLSDALAAQLRSRLALDPALDRQTVRIATLRATCERVRDQVALEPAALRPAAEQRLSALVSRVEAVAAKAQRGGDVGGLLGPLEHDAATTERDLIVAGATRREARGLVERATELRADLDGRGQALTSLVRRCVEQVTPAPRYAVPEVEALGPVPQTTAEVQAYLARLEQVSRAMQVVQHAYSGALAELDAVTGGLGGYVAKARALGVADHPVLRAVEDALLAVLEQRPCPVRIADALVATYRDALGWAGERGGTGTVVPPRPDARDVPRGTLPDTPATPQEVS
ncbi:hypothetical protein [Auraticoccus monumenti]|uniref:Uncharacterized protein n=1 Tax=Auraticoccus monumenti TaxID=675864 RepID=A0A1G7AIK6_9ACTN|nr:hypothetical protein [Auraticoccus monumenti]SDE14629.1 hypothetical protein SAMN04489747_2630 [Auraticoccus monumenti]